MIVRQHIAGNTLLGCDRGQLLSTCGLCNSFSSLLVVDGVGSAWWAPARRVGLAPICHGGTLEVEPAM